ncbi:MAG: O-antigen ligase family protein, partial [Rickettsiales bacterium]|nr:O-antigen ligase family protein [Rickettsiales bacterium]
MMKIPDYAHETFLLARRDPLWGIAFFACALIPIALIFSRAGAEICCAIMGLAFLWRSFSRAQWGWLKEPFSLVCLIAWGWLVLVVTPFAVSPEKSLVEALPWFRLPLMLLALRYFILKPPFARAFLGVMLALTISLVVVDTLWQLLTDTSLTGNLRIEESQRLTGPFLNPKVGIFMGKLLLACTGLCVFAALAYKKKRVVVASLAWLATVVVTIIFTGERAAFLSTVLGCIVMALLLMVTEKRLRLPMMLGAVAAMALFVGLYLSSAWVQMRGDQMIVMMLNYPQSDYGQLLLASITMGKEHWLHGVGLRGFADLCPVLHFGEIEFRGRHPHNVYGEWFAEAGLLGLLLFVTMIALLAREAIQHLRVTRGAVRLMPALALAVLVQHFFPLIGTQSFFLNW